MIPLDRLSLVQSYAEISMAARFLSLDVQDVEIPGFRVISQLTKIESVASYIFATRDKRCG